MGRLAGPDNPNRGLGDLRMAWPMASCQRLRPRQACLEATRKAAKLAELMVVDAPEIARMF
jgi:hypothetical protein